MNATNSSALRALFAAVTLFAAAPLRADDPPAAPGQPDAAAEIEKLKAVFQTLDAEREKYTAIADNWYLANLDQLKDERTKAGDLDGVLFVKAERDRVAAKEQTTAEQLKTLPAAMGKLRATYDAGLKKVAEDAAKRTDAANRRYLAGLEALQLRLTKSGEIDQALVVKAEKDRFIDEIAGGRPGIAAGQPATPPVVEPPATPPPAAPSKEPAKDGDVARLLIVRSSSSAKGGDVSKVLLGKWAFIFEQNGWTGSRDFKADGTLIGGTLAGTFSGETNGPGKWEVSGDKVVVTFPSGIREEMSLPLDPKGTKVVGKRGRELKGVKEK